MYMSTKIISIRNSVYKLLKNAKQEGESFTDVIERLLKTKTKTKRVDLSDYFGALKDQDILDELEEDARRIRELSRFRE